MYDSIWKTGVLLCALGPCSSYAETIECTEISSVPYTISAQGIYCFTSHLVSYISTGNAITVNANNVVIDMNGWKLGGQAAGPSTQATGIYALQRRNITVKNGTVRGFKYGIYLQDYTPHTTSQAHIIEDVRADYNTTEGITVFGRGSIIRNNTLVATGDSSVCGARGINVAGPGIRVLNNDVIETRSGSCQAAGITVKYADGAMVRDNRVSGVSSGNSTGSWGIVVDNSDDAIVRGNDISDPGDLGLTITLGTGIYMDNLVSGATVNAYSGTGTDAGSRNYSD